jgi:hypothetical protein
MGSSSPNRHKRVPKRAHDRVYDEVRRLWVSATPEELVRQHWLQRMIHHLHYPKELLVVEKEIKELPHLFGRSVPDRRIDIVCYGKADTLYPLMMIECKASRLTSKAIDQVIGYNHHVNAVVIGVVTLEQVQLGFFDASRKKYEFYSVFPSFKELIEWGRP